MCEEDKKNQKKDEEEIKINSKWMDHLEAGAKLGKSKESNSADTNN